MQSSRQDAGNEKPRPTASGATGWSATEDYMMNQDASMVKDFADDVDTLLVFAGLFSAVLTAFVVESYQQLQADNAERTAQLLARISLQLESFTFNRGFLNSTAPALPLPSQFTPQSSALWINVLWFLSLLFSLAAALFGILAKQWLREYLKWYSTVSSPRENILVRQIRFEAWNEWNVAASISTIPALLELALVLFVCGLVVLLWTLNVVVAIVFTVATAIFLIIVSSFTLLPAIFKRCPYKSPTAWACALAFDFIGDAARYCANYARLYLGRVDMIYSGQLRWKLAHWRTHARTWRERDIANITASTVLDSRGKKQDAIAVMHEELASELVHLDDTGNLEGDPMFERVTLDAVDQTLHAVAHLTLLFRALTWVSLASQDSRIQEQVTRCATSMHSISAIYEGTRANISEVLGTNGVRNVSVWFLLSRSWPSRRVPRDLPDTVTDRTMVTTALRQCVRRGYSMQHIGEEGDKGAMRFKMHWDALEQEWAGLPSRFWEYVPQETLIITYLLASDIRTTVVKLLSFYYGHKDRNIRARRAVELICALWLVLLSNSNVWPTCMSLVVETYNAVIKSARRGWFEHSFPGLRPALLELIWQFMLVGISSDGQLVTYTGTAQWGMTAVNYGTLALRLDTTGNRDDQHIFVQAVAHYLHTFEFDTTPSSEDPDRGLIENMCALLERCLESSTPNAGCYGDTPWPQRLRELSPEVINAVRTARPQEFRRLVELLMQSNKAGLITGEARTHLDAWLDTLAEARSLTESWSGGRGREEGSSISGAVSRSTSRGDGRRRHSEAGRRHRAHGSTASGTSSVPSAPPPVPSKAPPHDGTRATGAHSSSG